jgi:hypothetical protein
VLPRLSVALVIAGLGLLWTGVARNSLGLIYLSILCTAIAGVALIVYTRAGRRQAVPPTAESEPGAAPPGTPAATVSDEREGSGSGPSEPRSEPAGPGGPAPRDEGPEAAGPPADPASPASGASPPDDPSPGG